MACHTANMAFMALKLGHPTQVSAEAGDVNPRDLPELRPTSPSSSRPAASMPPVTLHWYEGKKDGKKVLPPEELVEKAIALTRPSGKNAGRQRVDPGRREGHRCTRPDDYGADVFFSTGEDGRQRHRSRRRCRATTAATRARRTSGSRRSRPASRSWRLSNFDYAGLLTAAFLLGNVAIRTGKPFNWDGETCRATDIPEAAPLDPPRVPQGLGPDRLQRLQRLIRGRRKAPEDD